MAFALKKIHAIETEAFDFHNGIGGLGCGFRGVRVDEERSSWAHAILDV
jgi:hypothetical protein